MSIKNGHSETTKNEQLMTYFIILSQQYRYILGTRLYLLDFFKTGYTLSSDELLALEELDSSAYFRFLI